MWNLNNYEKESKNHKEIECDKCGNKTTRKNYKKRWKRQFLLTLLTVIVMFPVAYFVVFKLAKR